jgi:hypothetical protein
MGLIGGTQGGGGGLAIFLIPLLVVVILILVAGRKDDDPDGTRTQARYLGAITIVALFVALFAFFGTIHALTDLIVDKGSSVGSNLPKELRDILDQLPGLGKGGAGGSDNADWQAAARTVLLGIAASIVYVFHIRRARKVAGPDNFPTNAPGRVARAALYGACFVAAIIVIVAATKGFYGLFKVVGPSTFGEGNDDIVRQRGISEVISYAFLGLGATFIFLRAWHWLPEHREVAPTE